MLLVIVQSTQLYVEDVFVSSVSTVTTEVFKRTNSVPAEWQPNMCFEIYIQSPYLKPEDYQPFDAANPPTCVGLASGLTAECNLKAGSTDTLQFKFTEIDPDIANFASLRFNFTNFHTPFSTQKLGKIELTVFSDPDCSVLSSGQRKISISAVTIKARSVPSNVVSVTTTSDLIADEDVDNALIFRFTPVSSLSVSGVGQLRLYMPYWYSIGI